jgi:hypothetical protein
MALASNEYCQRLARKNDLHDLYVREGTELMSSPQDSSDVRSPIEEIWQASDEALTKMWEVTISDRENQELHMMIKNPVPATGLFRELFTGWKTLLFRS